jgi:predicted kinase
MGDRHGFGYRPFGVTLLAAFIRQRSPGSDAGRVSRVMSHAGVVPVLLVLNGPPAAGKSTIARLYADRHALSLRLDIDEIRDRLGAWRHEPGAAGLRARALATAMARDHLGSGHDVVVAQTYGRPEHLDELRSVAREAGAAYREIVLEVDLDTTLARFHERGGPRLAEALETPDGLGEIAELHRRVRSLHEGRPWATGVESITGDPIATYDAVMRVLAAET